MKSFAKRCAAMSMVPLTAMTVALGAFAPHAQGQEVPNGSSALVGSSTRDGLDAYAMGDYVPPQEQLDAAFGCAEPSARPDATKTVLLVPGIVADATELMAWNYTPQLTKEGFDVCWITPPDSGRGDLTQTGLYVANGIKRAHARLGKEVSILGHSAGPPAAMWGLRYDDEAASLVDDFVAVAGAIRGTTLIEPVCLAVGNCPVIAWQMHPESNFVQALNAEPLPPSISVTSIYSKLDEGIQPASQASSIAGARNIAVQDVCPVSIPGHLGILADNTTYQLVLDALKNDGPADPSRLPGDTCDRLIAPDLAPEKLPRVLPALPEALALLGEPRYASEPPLPSYAHADVAEPQAPGELAAGSTDRIQMSGATVTDGLVGSATGVL